MKYKVLRSAAHNFAHAFTSGVNGPAMSHQACCAVESGAIAMHIDLLTGIVEPELFDIATVSPSTRVEAFARHLSASGVDVNHVTKAFLDLRFMIKGTVAALGGPPPWSVPFECTVTIHDDRGNVHVGRIEDIWHVHEYPNRTAE